MWAKVSKTWFGWISFKQLRLDIQTADVLHASLVEASVETAGTAVV